MVAGRFLTAGVACAVMHNVILVSGSALGLHYAVSSVLSFATVLFAGYALHGAWTFPRSERGRASFVRYALSTGTNFPLFVAGMFLLVDLAGFAVPVAGPAVTISLTAFNFIAIRWALRA